MGEYRKFGLPMRQNKMIIKSIHPFVAYYGYKKNNGGYNFLLPGKEVLVEGADDILYDLLALSNGYNSVKNICKIICAKNSYKIIDIENLFNELIRIGVIMDAREQYLIFHKISSNPMPYLNPISNKDIIEILQTESHLISHPTTPVTHLEKLFESRESTRKFSGTPFTREEFLRLAWAIYGKIERSKNFPSKIGLGTVPSGGALYSLRLYAITVNVESFKKFSIYELKSNNIKFVNTLTYKKMGEIFKKSPPPIDLLSISTIFILVSDFKHVTQKYSNRGYRLAFLEAGHAAQNAYLWGAEQGKGILEFGGFNDEILANALKIKFPQLSPITVVIAGNKIYDGKKLGNFK